MEDQVPIKLTKDEAIVLFEFLSRFSEREELTIIDKSEEIVLWNILADLESILVEPFDPAWKERLAKARLVVREKGDG